MQDKIWYTVTEAIESGLVQRNGKRYKNRHVNQMASETYRGIKDWFVNPTGAPAVRKAEYYTDDEGQLVKIKGRVGFRYEIHKDALEYFQDDDQHDHFLSDEDVCKIRSWVQQGIKPLHIIVATDYSYRQVYWISQGHGFKDVKCNPRDVIPFDYAPPITDAQKDYIEDLLKDGLSVNDIAAQIDIPKKIVLAVKSGISLDWSYTCE